MEYNEVAFSLTNTGDAAVTGTLYETALPLIFASDVKGTGWSPILTPLDVRPGETRRVEMPTRGRSFLRVFLKRSDLQKSTTVNVVASVPITQHRLGSEDLCLDSALETIASE